VSFSGFASIFGLLGLLSLPIIFILHLLRERSKRHVVSSLSLWSFLEVEVRGSLPKRIPLTWLLVLHLLIAALLSFACSQPKVVMATKVKQARHMVVLLDVSESMLAHDVLPSRLDQAKLEADSLLGGLGPKDIATIVTFGGKTHWIGDTRQTSLQDIFTQISSIEAGEIGNNLEDALASSVSVLDQSLPAELHVLTDAAFAEPNFVEGSTYSIKWHLYGRSKSNQAVLGISTAPGGNSHGSDEIQVLARFGNFSDQSVQRVATLLADGKPVDSMPLQMEADSTIAQVWTVFGRPSSLTAKLVGGDDLPQDDSASLGMFYGDKVKVALVTENPYPLDRP
jgi:Ca-activated chloride channel family protein